MGIPIRLQLAKNVKKFRKKRGLTQTKLADATSIDWKYIQRIEGKNPPNIRIETLSRLAKALKTTPAELLDFKG